MAQRELLKPDYIGDGVYIHDEGYHLVLAVNHHTNKVVSLEKGVLEALIRYAKRAEFIENL